MTYQKQPGLSVPAQKLLDQLKDDCVKSLEEKRRPIAREECSPSALIWNLFNGEYEYSFGAYTEIFNHITQKHEA